MACNSPDCGKSQGLFSQASKSDVTVPIKLLHKGCMPKKAHADDACFDCYSAEDISLYPDKIYTVSLGFKLSIPKGWQAKILPRSGLSQKGLRVCNAPGTIDCGYLGEVKVLLHNESGSYIDFKVGDRIVQMELQRVPTVEFVEVDELGSSDRGECGFGSTGT